MKSLNTYIPKICAPVLGFLISLLGSLPLGYINVVGLQILLEKGFSKHLFFIIGIISIQFFVLKFVSISAKWLVRQKKLILYIDVFTVVFFALITYYFFTKTSEQSASLTQFPLANYPFLLGLFLNSLNFIQWPYWAGIYIYLFGQRNSRNLKIIIINLLLGSYWAHVLGCSFLHTVRSLSFYKVISISTTISTVFLHCFSVD